MQKIGDGLSQLRFVGHRRGGSNDARVIDQREGRDSRGAILLLQPPIGCVPTAISRPRPAMVWQIASRWRTRSAIGSPRGLKT